MSEKLESFEKLSLKLKTPIELFEQKYGKLMQDILDKVTSILEERIDFTKSDVESCININLRWTTPKKKQETPFIVTSKELFESFLNNPYFLEILLNLFSESNWHGDHFIYNEYDSILSKKRVYNKKGKLVAKTIPLTFVPNIPD